MTKRPNFLYIKNVKKEKMKTNMKKKEKKDIYATKEKKRLW